MPGTLQRNDPPLLSSPLPATCQVPAPPRPCARRRHRRRAAARLDPPSRLRRAYDAAAALTPCRLTCPHEPLPRPRRCLARLVAYGGRGAACLLLIFGLHRGASVLLGGRCLHEALPLPDAGLKSNLWTTSSSLSSAMSSARSITPTSPGCARCASSTWSWGTCSPATSGASTPLDIDGGSKPCMHDGGG